MDSRRAGMVSIVRPAPSANSSSISTTGNPGSSSSLGLAGTSINAHGSVTVYAPKRFLELRKNTQQDGRGEIKSSLATKSNNDLGTFNKISKTPEDDDDDDLLSHYACPKYNYEPLPLDLFPYPDPEKERFEASCFPCFKYYDLTKYTLSEARQLSAMDLIPKEALKTIDEQAHRTKRLKRSTAESAQVAGYYRYKNEGVEILKEGGKSDGGAKASAKMKKNQTAAAAARSNADSAERMKTRESGALFKSIMEPSKLTLSHSQLSGSGQNTRIGAKPAFSGGGGATSSGSGPNPQRDGSPLVQPQKQGNRMEFLARLRQGLTSPDKKATSSVSGSGSESGASSKSQPNIRTINQPTPPESSRATAPPLIRKIIPPVRPKSTLAPAISKSHSGSTASAIVKSHTNFNASGSSGSTVSAANKKKVPNSKPKIMEIKKAKAPTSSTSQGFSHPVRIQPRPAAVDLESSSSMDEEKMAAEALGVLAHEELGASDDEDSMYPFKLF